MGNTNRVRSKSILLTHEKALAPDKNPCTAFFGVSSDVLDKYPSRSMDLIFHPDDMTVHVPVPDREDYTIIPLPMYTDNDVQCSFAKDVVKPRIIGACITEYFWQVSMEIQVYHSRKLLLAYRFTTRYVLHSETYKACHIQVEIAPPTTR